jgi:uncharacterized repeat protein (TIGR01451 family)
MQSFLKHFNAIALRSHQLQYLKPIYSGVGLVFSIGFLGYATPAMANGTFCQSPYSEVYSVTQPAGSTGDLYAVHGPTGAAVRFTSVPASFGVTAINTAATDHVNKLVYYGDANKIYAWDAISNQHITVASNFQSLLTAAGYTGNFVTLSSGGAAFYNGALYVGVDGNRNLGTAINNFNQDFEIFRVNFSSDGKTATGVTPLNIKSLSAGNFTTNTLNDWGDFIISDTGTILALSNNRPYNSSTGLFSSSFRQFWKFDLNTNSLSIVGETSENAQLAKSGDGRLWGLRSSTVVQFDNNGGVIVTLGDTSPAATSIQSFDGAECVVGSASVGDRVWADTNGNGIQDSGELGLAGVKVAIYRDIDKDGVIDSTDPKLATQVTNSTGNYNFTELLPHDRATGDGHNDFIVKVESGVPTGYIATTPIQRKADLSAATEVLATADFGYNLSPVSVSGTVFSDADGSATINGGDAGTNAGSSNLTVYAVGSNGNVVDKASVNASGIYTLNNVPANTTLTLRLSNDSSILPGFAAPTDPTLPNTWVNTGENLNGTIDVTTVLGEISLTTTTSNITSFNFGIKQNTVVPPVGVGGFCQSPYSEVYSVTQPAGSTGDLYAVHGPTGAAVRFTSVPASFGVTAINTAATDHVNKLVYYGDANKIYAWDAISNQHITVASNFQSLLTAAGYTGNFVTLSSGGAAFYNGALYVGVDGNRNLGTAINNFNQDFEIFRVNFSSDGKTATGVTPLNIKSLSAGNFTTNTLNDWGDFIISDTGTILALSNNRPYNSSTGLFSSSFRQFWKFDLNTNSLSIVGETSENAQLAKSGDGRLWGLRSSTVVQFDNNGGVIVTLGDTSPAATSIQSFDGAECVVGSASVGDRVWADTNGNGIQDSGELGLAGVKVAIYRDIDKDGVIDSTDPKLATQVTNSTGNYNFTELLPHDRATGDGHNDFIVKVESGVPTGYTATTPIQKNADLSAAIEVLATVDFGYRPAKAKLLLVKRITAIKRNGETVPENFTTFVDDSTSTTPTNDDNHCNWLGATGAAGACTNTYTVGKTSLPDVQSGDEIEYTIYYLNGGGNAAKQARVCDQLDANLTFQTQFDSNDPATVGKGITLVEGNTTTQYLTNTGLDDKGQLTIPATATSCNLGARVGSNLSNDVVVVDVGTATAPLMSSTSAGIPTTSYGYIRFKAKVK